MSVNMKTARPPIGGTPLERVHDLLQGKGPNEGGWYSAQCPAHDDSLASFGYCETDEGGVSLHCFKGCTRAEILHALKLTEKDLHKPGYKPAYRKREFTLIDLAIAKGIPPAALYNFGVTDGYTYTSKNTGHTQQVVRIEYRLRDGTAHTKLRLRNGPSGNKDSWFDENTPGAIIPYGLQWLERAEQSGYLLIGEGESDGWTCALHGLPYLGIPGATNDKCLDEVDIKRELAAIPRVYVLQEPDQVKEAASLSQAGKGFYARVRSRLRQQGYTGEIFYLDFKQVTGYKDPNALHLALLKEKAFARFSQAIEEALKKAVPANDGTEEIQTERQALEKAIEEKDLDAIYDHTTLLAALPYSEYARYKSRIKNACSKINLNDLERCVNAERPVRVRDTSTAYEKTEQGMLYCPPAGEAVELSNFVAEILADVKTDDGAECARSYTVQATLGGRSCTFDIPAKEFAACGWVDEHIGARAKVTAGQSMKAHLVNAIKTCSDPREELHYSHTGWRKIAGTMGYLYAGGVLSQVSQIEEQQKKDLTQLCLFTNTALEAALQPSLLELSQVSQVSQEINKSSVRLTTPLSKYVLSNNQEDLQRAIRASLRFTDLAPDNVTMPLYASLMRAPLGEINFAAHLAGQSGWGKSEMAALLQQHYGAAMTADKLPGSWESTENSLEMLLFQAKDALVVIDDFKPKGPKSDQDRLHAKADRIFRQIGNGAARGRLTSDLEQRAERRPRCLLLSTGEDIPRGQSLKARGVILLLEECITSGAPAKKLTEAQRDARSGLYAQAMAGYIQWLAPRIETLQDRLVDLIADERDSLGVEGHARTNSNTAQMLLGIKCFLQFAYEAGALTAQEALGYLSRCTAALLQVANEAARENSQEKPSEQWRNLVLNAILSKKAHLVTLDGKNPGQQYGWTKSVRLIERDGETLEDETATGGGSQIGWIDGENIYLLPAAAYRVARELGAATGNEITTLEPTLRKFLLQDKMLASTDLDKARKTITVRRRVGPPKEHVQVEVLHLARGGFYPSDIDPSDTPDSLDSEASQSSSQAGSGVSQVSDTTEPSFDTRKAAPSNAVRSRTSSQAGSEVSQVFDTKAGESSHGVDSELEQEQESVEVRRWKLRIDAWGAARGYPAVKLSNGYEIRAGKIAWDGFLIVRKQDWQQAYNDVCNKQIKVIQPSAG